MIVLDNSGTNIALPAVASYFETDLPSVQWVVVGYNLTITALLLPVARLADIFGRKRVYLAGFAFFAAGAVLGVFAPNLPTVIAARVLLGIGAAAISINTITIALLVFSDAERGKVIGLNFVVLGIGSVGGPVVGGLLVSAFGWRAIYAASLPVAAVALVLGLLVLDESRISARREIDEARPRFDWPGAVISTAAILVFLLGMAGGQRVGWTSPWALAALFGSGLLMTLFIRWELRTAMPMIELRWFKRSSFSLPVFAGFMGFLATVSVMYLMPFYLQRVLEYSPGQAGLIMAPLAVAMGVSGPIVGRLSDRFGTRYLSLLGLVFYATGIGLFSRLTVETPLPYVLTAITVTGFGMGTFQPPNGSAILSSVERAHYGVVNGMLNLIRTGAWVVGIVLATTVVSSVMQSTGYPPSFDIPDGVRDRGLLEAFTSGIRYVYLGVIALVAMAATAVLIQRRPAANGSTVASASQDEGGAGRSSDG